MLKSIF
jgi:hypothetical protein